MPVEAAALFVSLEARTAAFTRGMSAAEARMQAFQRAAGASAAGAVASAEQGAGRVGSAWERAGSRMGAAGSRISGIGHSLNSLSMPMLAVAGFSIKMASDYDMSVNKIATLSSGSAADVKMLRDSILQLGGATAQSPVQLADALYMIESGGIKGKAALSILTSASKASAIGMGDTKTIATTLAGAINAYSDQGLTAASATNTLAMALKEGMTPTEALAPAIGKLLPFADQLGIKFNNVMAAMAAMTRQGIDAAQASTGLRTTLAGFMKPTKAVATALEGVGLSASKVRDSFKRVGLQQTFEMLWKAAGKGAKTIDEQKTKYASFFQSIQRGGGAPLILLHNLKANDQIVRDMSGSIDVVGKSFEKLRKQPGFQMKAGLQQVKNDMIILGEVLLPLIAPLIIKVAGAVKDAMTWFKGLSKPIQDVILAVGGIIAIGGPVLIFFGGLVSAIGALIPIVGALFSPIGLLVAALAGAAYLIISNWGAIVGFFTGVWGSIVQMAKDAANWVTTAWTDAGTLFSGVAGTIGGAFTSVWTGIVDAARAAVGWIVGAWQSLVALLAPIGKAISDVFGPVISAIVTGVASLAPTIGPAISALVGVFTLGFKIIKVIAIDPVIGVIDFFISIVSKLVSLVGPAMNIVKGAFSIAFKVIGAVIDPVIAVIKFLSGLIIGPLVAAFKIGMGVMRTVADVVTSVLAGGFTTAWNVIKTVMHGIATVISGAFQIIKGLIEVFTGVFTGNFSKMWQGVKDIFSGAVKAVVGIVVGAGKALFNAGWGIMKAIGSGISAAWAGVKSVIEGFINTIIDVINIIPGVNIGHVGGGGGGTHSAAGGNASKIAPGGTSGWNPGGNPFSHNATGGIVDRMGYFAGEDGPSHPEVILATNPRHRQRNLGLFAQAGQMLGVPGFAEGGINGPAANTPHFDIGGIISSVLGAVTNPVGTIASLGGDALGAILSGGSKVITDLLPGIPALPKWIAGLPSHLISKAIKFIEHKVSGLISSNSGVMSGTVIPGMAGVTRMVAEANSIAAHNYPYLWGGGHGQLGVGPYDCSGAVSAVLGAAGEVNHPYVAYAYESFGQPGPGQYVSTYASPGHVYMSLLGRLFGTSGQNPGGGANWFSGSGGGAGFVTRHPPGMAQGGIFDTIPQPLRTKAQQDFKHNPKSVLPGYASGGVTGPNGIATGSTVPKPTGKQYNQFRRRVDRMWNKLDLPGPRSGAKSGNNNWTGPHKPSVYFDGPKDWWGRSDWTATPNAGGHALHYPDSVVLEALDPTDRLYDWANFTIAHETAHTMQARSVFDGPVWQREGGAQAWTDSVLSDSSRFDSTYRPFVNRIKKERSKNWISDTQFGSFANGGWWNAVASAESYGGNGYKGNPIVGRGYSELSMPPSSLNFSALGNLPYHTPMNIAAGGRQVTTTKQDIGAGSSFLPLMGLYPQTVSDLGLSGGQFNVQVQRADGGSLNPMGGSAASGGGGVSGPASSVGTGVGRAAKPTVSGVVTAAVAKQLQAAKAAIIKQRKVFAKVLKSYGKRLTKEPEIFKGIRGQRSIFHDKLDQWGHSVGTNVPSDFVSFDAKSGNWILNPFTIKQQVDTLGLQKSQYLDPMMAMLAKEQTLSGKGIKESAYQNVHLDKTIGKNIRGSIESKWHEIQHLQKYIKQQNKLMHTGNINQRAQYTGNINIAKHKSVDLYGEIGPAASVDPWNLYGELWAVNQRRKAFTGTGQTLSESISMYPGDRNQKSGSLGSPTQTTPPPLIDFWSIPDRMKTILADVDTIHRSMAMLEAPGAGDIVTGGGTGTVTPTVPAVNTAYWDAQVAAAQQLTRVSQAQYGMMSNFTGPGPVQSWGNFLGSFATGITNVPAQGLAELHKGEAVIPASMNPFTGSGMGGNIQVILHGDAQRFKADVEVIVDGRRAQIVSDVNNELGYKVGMHRQNPAVSGRLAKY